MGRLSGLPRRSGRQPLKGGGERRIARHAEASTVLAVGERLPGGPTVRAKTLGDSVPAPARPLSAPWSPRASRAAICALAGDTSERCPARRPSRRRATRRRRVRPRRGRATSAPVGRVRARFSNRCPAAPQFPVAPRRPVVGGVALAVGASAEQLGDLRRRRLHVARGCSTGIASSAHRPAVAMTCEVGRTPQRWQGSSGSCPSRHEFGA
jgi:hypothetical protein